MVDMDFVISKHAEEQMLRRSITYETVLKILSNPDQIISDNENLPTVIYQSLIKEENRLFLYRVIINKTKDPNVVITVYKTTKISKYYESKI
jgi:hypothetical protein